MKEAGASMPLSLSFDPFCIISLPSGNPYLKLQLFRKELPRIRESPARGNVFFHLDKEIGLNLKW